MKPLSTFSFTMAGLHFQPYESSSRKSRDFVIGNMMQVILEVLGVVGNEMANEDTRKVI